MKKPLIWIIDEEWPDYDLECRILKEKYPDCEFKFSKYDYAADLEAFGKNADAILAQIYAELPRPVIEKLTRCQAIAVYGGGYDRVDVKAAAEKGVKVTNVSNYCKEDLADYVMAAVYHFYKQLSDLAANVKTLPWGAQAISAPPMRLSRSTLHIIGLGRIGLEVARKALANSLHVTAYDPTVNAEDMAVRGIKKTEWAEGLKSADYVSVNCILTEATANLFKYDDFKLMKPGAVLINSSRGQVIDQGAMVRALNEGVIRGAMLDVVQNEPPDYSEEIFKCPKALITPHVSYISVQSYEELKRRAANNVITALEGGRSPDLVN